MITSENGNVHMEGTAQTLTIDLYAIMDAAFESCPQVLLGAIGLLEVNKNEAENSKDKRLEAFAAALSRLPEEELEKIKRKMEETK